MVLEKSEFPSDFQAHQVVREGELDNEQLARNGFVGSTAQRFFEAGRVTGTRRELGPSANMAMCDGVACLAAPVVHLFDSPHTVSRSVDEVCLHASEDRVADSVLFLGLFLHYYLSGPVGHAGAVLAVLAVSGSNIASYFKARSEVEGVACNVGLVKRADRLILLMLLGMLGPVSGVPILSVLVLFSAHSMWARAAFVFHRLGEGASG